MQRFSALSLAKSVEESIAYPLRQRQLVLELRGCRTPHNPEEALRNE